MEHSERKETESQGRRGKKQQDGVRGGKNPESCDRVPGLHLMPHPVGLVWARMASSDLGEVAVPPGAPTSSLEAEFLYEHSLPCLCQTPNEKGPSKLQSMSFWRDTAGRTHKGQARGWDQEPF